MILLFTGIACGATAVFIPIYFIPLYLQFARGSTAISAGVHLLPYVIILVIFCIANGAIMSTTGYYQPWFLGGGILTIIGSALLYTIDENSSESRVYGYSVLSAVGGGSFIQAAFSVAQATVGKIMIPEAIGFITLGQLSGGTISLAIANTVFLNAAAKDIAHIVPQASRDTIFSAISGGDQGFLRSLSAAARKAVIHAIVDSMRQVWILAITAGALVVVASLGMKRERLFMKPGAAG